MVKVGIKELSTRRPRIKREPVALCKDCRVQDYGACPNLLALHDNGYTDPPVKKCAWKDYFDNAYEKIFQTAVHSRARKKK